MDCVAYKNMYIENWQICLLKNNYIYIQIAGGKMHSEEISHAHCLILVQKNAGVNTSRQYLYCKGRVLNL